MPQQHVSIATNHPQIQQRRHVYLYDMLLQAPTGTSPEQIRMMWHLFHRQWILVKHHLPDR